MEIADWLAAAKADALKRQLPELVPLLEGLAASTAALRSADEAQRLRAEPGRPPEPQGRMTMADLRTISDVAPLHTVGRGVAGRLWSRSCLAAAAARPGVNAFITLLRDSALDGGGARPRRTSVPAATAGRCTASRWPSRI